MNLETSLTHCTEVYAGDLLYFHRKNVHALVRKAGDYNKQIDIAEQPETVDLVWIDGYSPTFGNKQTTISTMVDMIQPAYRTENIKRSTIESRISDGEIGISKSGLKNRAAINRAPGLRNPDDYKANETTNISKRYPVSKLSFNRIHSLTKVNGFLKNPLVGHKHGRIAKAKAIFTATHQPTNNIAAALTVNSVNAREAFDRATVEITRYASHPDTDRTDVRNNCATWMISNACQWAGLEGFETVKTYAGTDGNEGGIYKHSNFTFEGVANSSGKYNRDGRKNQSHANKLKIFTNDVSFDGEKADKTMTIPKRVEERLESGCGQTPQLDAFATETERTPDYFQFTREDVSDHKFAKSDIADQYPDFSDKLHTLVDETDCGINLADHTDTRRKGLPAAAFGAAVDGTLVAALLVDGDTDNTNPTATISGYTARKTKYPQSTAQWLLTKARDWSLLTGYDQVTVNECIFTSKGLSSKLPKGVGFADPNGAKCMYAD